MTISLIAASKQRVDVNAVNGNEDRSSRFYDRLRHLIPFLKRCLEFVIYICIATLVIQQIQLITNVAVFGAKIVKIVGIIFISRVLFEVVYLLVEEVLFLDQNLSEIQTSRRRTLVPLIRSFLQYLVYFGAIVSILYTLDINPTLRRSRCWNSWCSYGH